MLLPALLATLALAQDLEPIPPTLYDRVIELEITAEDEPAIEGRGPTAFAEYEAGFEGTLHIWARSRLDLLIQVDDAAEARSLASGDNASGGSGPYVSIEVRPGDWLVILVAGNPGATGPLTLHLSAAPITKAGRDATRLVLETQAAVDRLIREGQPAAARDLFTKALPGFSLPDFRHPGFLLARANLAVSVVQLGDLQGARALFESGVAARKRTLPEDHFDLLLARANLAVVMERMGDLVEARAVHESVLAGYERTLPASHPDHVRARASLATSMLAMGESVEARALLETVLAIYARTLPEDHHDALIVRGNLAASMSGMGDLAGARALFEQILAARERALPGDHPELLRARANVASSMHAMGDWAGARALLESVLAARERTLPADHPDIILTRANLSGSMMRAGDLVEARVLRERVLAVRERTLPEHHPDLLRARADLAISLHQEGDLAGARAVEEAVLEARERTLPADHPDVLTARGRLAITIEAMGDLAAARALKESVLAASERIRPAGHPDLLVSRGNLMVSMQAMGDLAGARALLPVQIRGIQMRALASLALAPRQARQAVASESGRLSKVMFLVASAGPDLERSAFELVETLRLVVAESARSLARFDADPELAPILVKAAETRRALNDLVAGAAREGATDLPVELTRLSLERDRLEREASRRLALRGVVTDPVRVEALRGAIGPGSVAVSYRRIRLEHLVPTSGAILESADHLLAHVLTSEGRLTRVDLGPASELSVLASEWRRAMGAPIQSSQTGEHPQPNPGTDAIGAESSDQRGLALRDSGSYGEGEEWSAGCALRARILDPVLAVAGGQVKRAYVCGDDLLFLLPLDALPMEPGESGGASDGGQARIGDRVSIVNEVSFARILAPATPLGGESTLLALGGVDYDGEGAVPEGLTASSAPIEVGASNGVGGPALQSGGKEAGTVVHSPADGEVHSTSRGALTERFQHLLQARFETEATADLFEKAFEAKPVLLTRERATKAGLFEAAPGKRFLHLATHGWFAPESVRSTADAQSESQGLSRLRIDERVSGLAPMTLCGLALAGANKGRDSLGRVPGILTAEELCSLDLSRCELAVLSACETNVGVRRAGQGIQSLQSALYAAGARTSITSLWKVDDAATRKLFELFYTYLWGEKVGKAEALWKAKTDLRDAGHPLRDWAGWVLTGAPE